MNLRLQVFKNDTDFSDGTFSCRESLIYFLNLLINSSADVRIRILPSYINSKLDLEFSKKVIEFFGYDYEFYMSGIDILLNGGENIRPYDLSMLIKIIREDITMDKKVSFEDSIVNKIYSTDKVIKESNFVKEDIFSRNMALFMSLYSNIMYLFYLLNRDVITDLFSKARINGKENGIFNALNHLFTKGKTPKYTKEAYQLFLEFHQKFNISYEYLRNNQLRETITNDEVCDLLKHKIDFYITE